MNIGTAAQSSDSPSRTTQADPQVGLSGEAVVGERVAAKYVQISRGLIVASHIERISVERARTGTKKVVSQVAVYRLWE